nr:guanylate cyclase 32E-like [Cherax quadricarinatus]
MLFSDIVGFTSICSTATPLMVINMLQNLYTQFDAFCGQLDVYKVETIGDAYCVAGNLHRRSAWHAHQVAWMALKMMCSCTNHTTHDGQRIQDGLKRRMAQLKDSIEETNNAVDKEREKNVSLLHLIFPPDIAKRLWLGEVLEAQKHDEVTMLFSDIVGFTSICSTATPLMVINMLQNLYNAVDAFCGQLDVLQGSTQVETIGDAYCVAGNLHRRSAWHAHQVAWMALKMMCSCTNHTTHDGQRIQETRMEGTDANTGGSAVGSCGAGYRCGQKAANVHWSEKWIIAECEDGPCVMLPVGTGPEQTVDYEQ